MNYLRTILLSTFVILIILLLLNKCTSCNVDRTSQLPLPNSPRVDTIVRVDTVFLPDTTNNQQVENDSIARVVENIGGDGNLKITLLWNFHGDIDLHVLQPNQREIFYRNKKDRRTGGKLDVDNTAGGRGAAENIYWSNPPSGCYKVSLVYYRKDSHSPNGGPCTVVVKRLVNGTEKIDKYTVNMNIENKNHGIFVTECVL